MKFISKKKKKEGVQMTPSEVPCLSYNTVKWAMPLRARGDVEAHFGGSGVVVEPPLFLCPLSLF